MKRKKIISLMMTLSVLSSLTANIVSTSAHIEDENYAIQYRAQFNSELKSEIEVPRAEITATATSEQNGEGAEKTIDGSTDTIWHTSWDGVDLVNDPQSLELDLGKVRNVSSVHVTPRQDGGVNGRINGYKLYAGDTVVAEGNWKSSAESRYIILDEPVATDNLRLEVNSSYGNDVGDISNQNKFVSMAEIVVYEEVEAPTKLIETENLDIVAGVGGALTESLDDVKDLEEGTILISFLGNSTNLQSLFSVSNNTRENEHFNIYQWGGIIGYELRKDSGNVSTGKVSTAVNPGLNTLAFVARKDGGYSMILNGSKILDVTDLDAAFLTSLEEANAVDIGKVDRFSGNEYPMTSKVDYVKVYNKPISDRDLLELTSETVAKELPLPEGALKTDPVEVFSPGQLESNNFRIPSIITTTEGTLIAGIDVRKGGGHDSPNDINTGVKRSTDNGATWDEGQIILDYPDKASGIDSALLQDETTGEIFLLVDAFPDGRGCFQATRGSGFTTITVDGEEIRAINLTHTDGTKYYGVLPKGDEFGKVVDEDGNVTSYQIKANNDLYKDGVKIGNTFGSDDELKADGTCFLALISSKDDGLTWSEPHLISGEFKLEWQSFLGTGPGRGLQIKNGEHAGRLIFPVYSLNVNQRQSSAVIYSDDHGLTWQMGESVNDNRVVNGITISAENFVGASGEEMTESQVVEMPNGDLKLFMRNPSRANPAVATSKDGGLTWENTIEYETDLREPYCQLSVMNYSGLIDGKPALIFANPDSSTRAEGTVQIGLIDNVGTEEEPVWDFEWKYSQLVKPGHYAYSCLTETKDGTIGLFYEGTANEEMEYTEMNIEYLKADLLAEAPSAKITSISSYEGFASYKAGDVANLKVVFDQAVALFGERNVTLLVDGKEMVCTVETLSKTEYKLTGTVPADITDGEYTITVKANEDLEVINVVGKTTDLSADIELESTLVIENEAEVVVDKAELGTVIEAAEAKEEADYTVESWAVFAEALEAANTVYNNEAATQEEVDSAKGALQTAMDSLVEVEVEVEEDFLNVTGPSEVLRFTNADFAVKVGEDVEKVRVTFFWNENGVEKEYVEYYDVEDAEFVINRKMRFSYDYDVEFTPVVDGKAVNDKSQNLELNVLERTEESVFASIKGNGEVGSTNIEELKDVVVFKIKTALDVERIRFVFETSDNYTEFYNADIDAKEVDGQLVWTIRRPIRTFENPHQLVISAMNENTAMYSSDFEITIGE